MKTQKHEEHTNILDCFTRSRKRIVFFFVMRTSGTMYFFAIGRFKFNAFVDPKTLVDQYSESVHYYEAIEKLSKCVNSDNKYRDKGPQSLSNLFGYWLLVQKGRKPLLLSYKFEPIKVPIFFTIIAVHVWNVIHNSTFVNLLLSQK